LDGDPIHTAQEFTGVRGKSVLVREAPIERETAQRLAALGGSMPELADIPPFKMS
jgi:hypothetical protein